MKRILFFSLVAFVATSCKQKPQADELSKTMTKLFEDYYEERLQLYPLEATAIADNRYNDLLPADISDSYRQKLKAFYEKYQNELVSYDRAQLKGQDATSYDVLKHETEIQLEGLK